LLRARKWKVSYELATGKSLSDAGNLVEFNRSREEEGVLAKNGEECTMNWEEWKSSLGARKRETLSGSR
jgi:hypothetical protein